MRIGKADVFFVNAKYGWKNIQCYNQVPLDIWKKSIVYHKHISSTEFQDLVLGDDYRYINQAGEEIDVTLFSLLGKVPQNYQLFECLADEEGINEIYVNDEGDILCFSVMKPSYEGELFVVSDAEKLQQGKYA